MINSIFKEAARTEIHFETVNFQRSMKEKNNQSWVMTLGENLNFSLGVKIDI